MVALILEVLGSLLESVSSEPGLSIGEAGVDILQLVPGVIDVLVQVVVLLLELLIIISLLGIQVIEPRFVLKLDLLNLPLVLLDFGLSVPLLCKKDVQVGFLFVILAFDHHEERFDIFGFGVGPVFVQGQVVVSQLALVLANVLDE